MSHDLSRLAPADGAAESALDPVRRLGAYIERHFGGASHPLEGALELRDGLLSATGLRLQGNGAWLAGEATLHTRRSRLQARLEMADGERDGPMLSLAADGPLDGPNIKTGGAWLSSGN